MQCLGVEGSCSCSCRLVFVGAGAGGPLLWCDGTSFGVLFVLGGRTRLWFVCRCGAFFALASDVGIGWCLFVVSGTWSVGGWRWGAEDDTRGGTGFGGGSTPRVGGGSTPRVGGGSTFNDGEDEDFLAGGGGGGGVSGSGEGHLRMGFTSRATVASEEGLVGLLCKRLWRSESTSIAAGEKGAGASAGRGRWIAVLMSFSAARMRSLVEA